MKGTVWLRSCLDYQCYPYKVLLAGNRFCLCCLCSKQHVGTIHKALLGCVSPALDFRVEVAEVSRDAQFIQQASVCLCAAEGTASVLTSSMAELEQLRARMGHSMLLQQQVTYSLCTLETIVFFSFGATVHKACTACNPNHKTTRTPSTVCTTVSWFQSTQTVWFRGSVNGRLWRLILGGYLFRGKFYS